MDLSPAALFGPRSPEMSSYANSMCRYLHIPHLEYREEPTYRRTASFSINLHPSPVELAKAYLDVINYYNMDHLMILYASSSGKIIIEVVNRFSILHVLVFSPSFLLYELGFARFIFRWHLISQSI